jgi:hypothetical protein
LIKKQKIELKIEKVDTSKNEKILKKQKIKKK